MCREQCKEKRSEFQAIYENEIFTEFTFQANIEFPDGKQCYLRTSSDIRGTNALTSRFSLALFDDSNKQLAVLFSEFFPAHDQMCLKLIEVSDVTLRNYGLGTRILAAWLNLLPYYAQLHNIHFSTIEGTVACDGGFTPDCAKKLYRRFDGYKFSHDKKLRLDTQLLETKNQLKYNIEFVTT